MLKFVSDKWDVLILYVVKLNCPVDVYDFEMPHHCESPNRADAAGVPTLPGKWRNALGP